MSPRLAILAGLLSGILVAALVLGGIFVLAPGRHALVPTPSPPPSPSAASGKSVRRRAPAGPSTSPGPRRSPGASASGSALFGIGQPAPALVVPQVGGGGATIDLATLKGKPVWVNFMATWCPPCQDEFPLMNGFAARYAADGLVVIAIDVKEDEGTVAAFAESLAATFPLGLDATGAAAEDVGRARPARSTSGSMPTGSCATAPWAASGRTSWPAACRSIMPGVTVTP